MNQKFGFATLALGLLAPAALAAPSYAVTSLGTLPGTDSSVATGLNDAGQVVGYSGVGYSAQAFVWQSGATTALGNLPGGSYSYGYSINGSGVVAGYGNASGGAARAYQTVGGTPTDLGVNSSYPNNAIAYGINASGAVVGKSEGGINARAIEWSGGTASVLDSTDYRNTFAYGVNDSGVVVGYGNKTGKADQALLWSGVGGALTVLPSLADPLGYGSFATGINGSGQVVGASGLDAVLWSGGVATDLGNLDPTGYSVANAINAAGLAVGTSYGDAANRAFLWNGTSMVDLNSLIDPASGFTLVDARGINASGQIVGTALYRGQAVAFVAQPVPEPGAMAALGLGALGIVRRTKRGKVRNG